MGTDGVLVTGGQVPELDRVLTPDALAFVADLQRRFGQSRLDLLHRRQERQAAHDAGEGLDFPAGTAEIRDGDWTVAPAPADFRARTSPSCASVCSASPGRGRRSPVQTATNVSSS
jgi:malate synthase